MKTELKVHKYIYKNTDGLNCFEGDYQTESEESLILPKIINFQRIVFNIYENRLLFSHLETSVGDFMIWKHFVNDKISGYLGEFKDSSNVIMLIRNITGGNVTILLLEDALIEGEPPRFLSVCLTEYGINIDGERRFATKYDYEIFIGSDEEGNILAFRTMGGDQSCQN